MKMFVTYADDVVDAFFEALLDELACFKEEFRMKVTTARSPCQWIVVQYAVG